MRLPVSIVFSEGTALLLNDGGLLNWPVGLKMGWCVRCCESRYLQEQQHFCRAAWFELSRTHCLFTFVRTEQI